ncbi:hypothetical protein EDB86DRAFT_3241086 [Lactarius hatsudake]|nr:hypothetical protein EDB86DRAFT_3241086 [Lactarius hatsudake]
MVTSKKNKEEVPTSKCVPFIDVGLHVDSDTIPDCRWVHEKQNYPGLHSSVTEARVAPSEQDHTGRRTATISAGVGFVVMCRAGLRSKAWAWSWKALYGASNLGNHSAKGNKIYYSYAVLSASKGASWGLVHHVGMVPVRADSRVTKSGCGGHGFVYGEAEVEECARGALLTSAGETARQVRRWQWDLSLRP